MKCVNPKDLKNISEVKEIGGFSKIFSANLDDKEYCYKLFSFNNGLFYDKEIYDNLAKLTDEDFSSEFLVPKYMVGRADKCRFIGYLADATFNAHDLGFVQNKGMLLRYLRIGRDLIDKLHREYKYIHADINEANVLVDTTEDKLYLCDFDSALRFNQEIKTTCSFSDIVYNYLQYQKFDKNVDVFCYNLMTLELLLDVKERENVFDVIAEFKKELLNSNDDVKRLSKELINYEGRKALSGEYIIDYIDKDYFNF